MSSPLELTLSPLGDRALRIELGRGIDPVIHRRVRAVCARLESRPVAGMIELVPAFASVAVHYDPALVPHHGIGAAPYARFAMFVEAALVDLREVELPEPRIVEIPVCYGGEFGPDLEDVAQRHAITPDEAVRLHSEASYSVYMLGFAPGFAYLGGLPAELATPRRDEPRVAVPAGSVGIGGIQTGIYPLVSPGGWQLIGRTPLRLFDPAHDPPTLLDVGDRVCFRPIAPHAFATLAAIA
jgi:inhibitor of KinA